MKVKKLLFILLVLVVGLTSCSKKSDLSDSIPANAFYVVRVDANSLIKKSEYDVFQNPLVQKGINLGRAFMKDNEVKLLNSFLENANSLGVDLKGEYYIYMTDDKFGLILKVLDAKKLKESFDVLAKGIQVESSNGIYSVQNSGSTIVWNDDKIILSAQLDSYLDSKSSDSLLTETKSQLSLSENESINSNPQFKTFISEAKDVSLYYAISKLQGLSQVQDNKQVLEVLKEFDGVSIVSYQDFETGKIKTTGKYLYDSNDTEKRFKTYAGQFSSTLKGDQLNFIPQDPLFFATVNLKGQNIAKYIDTISGVALRNNGYQNKELLDNIQEVLQFLDGDATFAISDIYTKNTQISDTLSINKSDDYASFDVAESENIAVDFTFLADVTNVDSLSNMLQNVARGDVNQFQEISPNVYRLVKDPNNIIYLGLKGNLAFATSIESVYTSIINNKPLEKAFTANVKNKYSYMTGDISKFNTSLINDLGLGRNPYYDPRMVAKILSLANLFNKFELSVDADSYAMDGDIFLTNTKDNSLKSITKAIDLLISNLAPNVLN